MRNNIGKEVNMKKLKRILIIFLIIISISMFIKNILLAVYTDGYMKIYNNTSSYLDCSDTTTQGYIGDNIGIPTGIPGNNDYKYIIAVEPRAWCTADKQVDTSDLGTGDCKIVAIIDIGKPNDPVNTTIFDPNGTKKNAATSVSKKNRAQSAFTMYAGTEKSITAVAQKHFIQRFKDYSQHIKRFSVSMYSDNTNLSKNINGKNYTYATYSDAINNLNYEDAGVIDKKGIVENSDTAIYSYNSTNFKTKISNLDIDISSASSLVSSRTIKINGTSYNMKLESSVWYLYTGTTKKGVYDKSKGIIYMNDKIDVTSFELTVKYKYIHGRVYLLGTNYSQQRAVSLGKEVEGQYTQTVNIDTYLLNVDVSMQKYIVTVTNSDGNKTYDDNGQYKRNSLQTYVNEKSSYFKYNVAKNRAGKSGYKYDNPRFCRHPSRQ